MWVILAVISAILLGIYDLFKKIALKDNAVIPVLFFNTLVSSILVLPLFLLSHFAPSTLQHTPFFVPPINFSTHLYLLGKAVIVLSSWLFGYFAIKNLPLTISSTIKAMQPMITLTGAILIYDERLNFFQWIGVILALVAFVALSRSGKKEGIKFAGNKWVIFIILSIILGAGSGLYDKFLLRHFDQMNVQVWFTFYQFLLMSAIMLILWRPWHKHQTRFIWKWTIPMISIFLLLADFMYFYALSMNQSMISIVSLLRRSSVVITFIGGAIYFKEKNVKEKALDLLLVLIGMLFIFVGSYHW